GYLLKQQFDAGNFVTNVYSYHPKYTFKPLPAFKHLVIDGNLYVMRERDITRSIDQPVKHQNGTFSVQWNAPIEFTSSQKENGYNVLAGYEDIVKTKIQNDTLYISFFKPHGENMSTFNAGSNLLS